MFEEFKFHANLECRCLLQEPDPHSDNPLLVLALHGYGQNAAAMLRLTGILFGVNTAIASLQGPNQTYLSSTAPDSAVGYNWGTRANTASCVKLHHEMVLYAVRELRRRFGAGPERILLMGFSQPVGFNYRFAGTHPNEVGGVIGICGGVPKDWESGPYHAFSTPILHIARDEDDVFPANIAKGFPERLRHHASDVEFHMLPGGHRFPSKAGQVAHPWVNRVFGGS
jgi:predicted esterase